ncbi:1,4-alpha-glucan branching protein GlgB [Reyranella sp.]|jgi:1,4-alpha-glucan branching enzyme|uniref:1,4-alpha-glucan branching protein GlgB n=1 Tax=Reyranella sp. TaxID=1929291 RepID=UPI000BDD4493|nr:1,4-alpha-glucan branching protein GlgB [Reyranella sp.]OYY40534.1 MAG: 1,4-alpha-glucan branching enzyme [Rhodospirillales bacterium 35-66-84]OYZ93150.1 MAG: 1,4-alpha-glucan branching enzyme [Rhodospirillales bacterium 24-66-33]OZB24280.1 MAG: 1,4-alpha-glucan branching enzyme [Rhodospirillales bacterium 39-66-50]HQS18776.1 1,4-alpha-glucan branching protein GlgB [Reyranella sp.]HQT14914.1 1,4-alpha-glucan branching protein GlgB [Reyranella sp.]
MNADIQDDWLDRDQAEALTDFRPVDAFAVLGPHPAQSGRVIRALLPGALGVEVTGRGDKQSWGELKPGVVAGLFEGRVEHSGAYLLRIRWPDAVQETEDPYAFGPALGDLDLHLFSEGRHFELAEALGANVVELEGVRGVRFAVWAPNAQRVALIGDFNSWDRRRHPMRLRPSAGVWEIFIPRLGAGTRYKFDIVGPQGQRVPDKADPVAQQAELAPGTASVVGAPAGGLRWTDHDWMAERAKRQSAASAISIYEVHAGSWMRQNTGSAGAERPLWDFLTERLIPYVKEMGFTHVEMLPVTEHPFGGSWGYQPLGLFAPAAIYGPPESFARFVDAAHRAGIGVLLDWVPAHFPTDPHGLARFDGTALYEHLDPREGYHHDWNTYIYNFGRREVQGFLIASALHWLERFHVDGLRVDAVASMLYRDYSRPADAWIPNVHGGRENLEAIGFLRHLNAVVAERAPGAIVIAEESTAWPGVTAPLPEGLGFSFKWNMGWMHDTLQYVEHEPVYRAYHHDQMTFGLVYAFSERFVLPISHDEVVHGKGSLLGKMPGDRWQRFANLRAYLGFMWAHPGKKLLFMGCEIAQDREWNHDGEIDWHLLEDGAHAGIQRLVRDLNHLYAAEPALHESDADPSGFSWIVGDDRANSVYAFFRTSPSAAPLLVVCNMTPVPRHAYRIGVPKRGRWREVANTDSRFYGGSDLGNDGGVSAVDIPSHGQSDSIQLSLPPLATVILRSED